jgi:hypothetical protein
MIASFSMYIIVFFLSFSAYFYSIWGFSIRGYGAVGAQGHTERPAQDDPGKARDSPSLTTQHFAGIIDLM